MSKFLLASLLCIAADGVSFTSPDGKFKVEFPAQPKESEQKVQNGTVKMFAVMQGTSQFSIAVMHVPNAVGATPEELDKILDTTRDGLIATLKAKVISQEKIQLDKKYPGREVVVELPGGIQLRDRFFLVDTVLYQVIVAGPGADALKAKEATGFFNTFRLAK